jgi:hypothetical protein
MGSVKEWITPIVALLGVIVGGGIGWLNTRLRLERQEAREKKKRMLEKLESLHEAISRYLYAFTSLATSIVQLQISGKPIDERSLTPPPLQRLRMLVGFYAPELGDQLKEIEHFSEYILNPLLPALDSRLPGC